MRFIVREGVIGDCEFRVLFRLLNEGKIIIPDDSNLKKKSGRPSRLWGPD